MGRLLQLLFKHRRENLVNMLRIAAVLVLASVAQCAPGGGHFAYGHQQKHCHTKYNIKYEQACHEEYDVVVDTTYIEECQDTITTHCHETSQQVHHSSAVVGHDSKVVDGGYGGYGGYGKREAEAEAKADAKAEAGKTYSTGPKCQDKKDRQCHKIPKQNSRKIPRKACKTIVDTTYIEQCQDIITTHCEEVHQKVSHSSAVVGHDSKVVSHGYGGYAGYGY